MGETEEKVPARALLLLRGCEAAAEGRQSVSRWLEMLRMDVAGDVEIGCDRRQLGSVKNDTVSR